MKVYLFCFLCFFLVSASLQVTPQVAAEKKSADNQLSRKEIRDGWKLLFNGISFEGWRGINKEVFPAVGWKIKDGLIYKTPEKGGDIVTMRKYGNFILEWEWKMASPGGNSGLKYFVNERTGDTGGYGYGLEYQILDDNDWISDGRMKTNDYHTLGALYELYPPLPGKMPNPLGEWNKSRIVSKGPDVEHWLNGKLILKYERGSTDFREKVAASKFRNVVGYGIMPEGHILLQDHDSEIYFRNLKIKELK